MAICVHIDFETRSDLDLTAVGFHNYARSRHTDIMCMAYAFDENPVYLWRPGMKFPEHVANHIESGGRVHAHNATFEQEIINCVGTRLYGFPHLYTEQLVCTMAQAYAMGLPGSLDRASAALGVDQKKDLVGGRLMRQYCHPRAIESGKIIWWDKPEDLNRIYEYCRQDVVVEREIGRRMLPLSDYERHVWQLDQKINARGVRVDVPAVIAGRTIVEAEKQRLIKEMQHASNNQIAAPTAIGQIKDFLKFHGLADVESLAKADVTDLLGNRSLPEPVRKVLEIRKAAGKTSTAKLESMVGGASPTDFRLRGMFQYSGANTRRWTGRRVQLQNLPRPKINAAILATIIEQIKQGITAHEIDSFYGSPLDVVSNCLRGFLVATPGHVLLCSDFSSIEARVIAWLSGEESALTIFKTHGKIYEHAAARIFGKQIDQVTDSQRQVGKVAVLALGFGGGVGALETMARGYGVNLEAAFEALYLLATPEQRERVRKSFQSNGKRYEGITEKRFIASDLTKTFWRLANPNIVQLWADLESSAIEAVESPGLRCTHAEKITFRMQGSFLWCRLPSGGVLCYPYPQIKEIELPWGGTRPGLTYMAEDGQSHKWMRFKTYGGSLAENVTQAVARDLLADAMLRLEAAGYPVVLHAHDEIVCEMKEGSGTLERMSQIMSEVPAWATGLPIKAAGWKGFRYRK